MIAASRVIVPPAAIITSAAYTSDRESIAVRGDDAVAQTETFDRGDLLGVAREHHADDVFLRADGLERRFEQRVRGRVVDRAGRRSSRHGDDAGAWIDPDLGQDRAIGSEVADVELLLETRVAHDLRWRAPCRRITSSGSTSGTSTVVARRNATWLAGWCSKSIAVTAGIRRLRAATICA